MEIIFSIISFHSYLSGAELYLNVQVLENIKDIHNRDNFKVDDRDLRMTTQVGEQIVCSNPYVVDNVAVNMSSRHTKKQFDTVDSDVI